MFSFVFLIICSMTTLADLNDKWASYAGPGGWNGRSYNIQVMVDTYL